MNYPQVTLTCTTGRRLDFFKETIKTFNENCEDMDLIKEIIICDDRSTNVDIENMKHLCISYGMPEVKVCRNQVSGQLYSLKLLYEKVKIETEYVMHIEDDWKFLIKDNFIRKAFDVMFSDDRIKQVTLRFWDCMYVKDRDIEYRMHVYSPMEYSRDWDIIKYNDCTYGGLSFNPSILHVPTVRKCLEGIHQDHPENRGWDKEVSKKFWDMGYKRANLNENYIWHIGGKLSFYTRNK